MNRFINWLIVISQGSLPDVTHSKREVWIYLISAGILTGVSSLLSDLKAGQCLAGIAFNECILALCGHSGSGFSKGKSKLAGSCGSRIDGYRSRDDCRNSGVNS
jgi:hypothetical protein